MSEFFSLLKLIVFCGTLFFIATVVLLSLPQSRLRSVGIEIVKWAAVGVLAILVVSPIDLLPGVPFDDIAYILGALASGNSAVEDRKKRLLMEQAELEALGARASAPVQVPVHAESSAELALKPDEEG